MENFNDVLTHEEKEFRDKFIKDFSSEALQKIPTEELPIKLFGSNNNSMINNVEYNAGKFGGVTGYKNKTNPIHYKDKSWKKSDENISEEEARKICEEIRDTVKGINSCIENKNFEQLYNLLYENEYFKYSKMHKYLCILYPKYFLWWHAVGIREKILKKLNLSGSLYNIEKYYWDKYKNKIDDLNMNKISSELEEKYNLNKHTENQHNLTDINDSKNLISNSSGTEPLNQILYGPPGTGKTYNTIIKAMEIIKNEKYEDKDITEDKYEKLKKEFEDCRKNHQIEFITFHQSYSYEEFVEGIRPVINSDNTENLKYEYNEGVFKRIVKNALVKSDKVDNFEEVWDKFVEFLNENDYIEIPLLSNKRKIKIEVNEYGNGICERIYPGDEYKKGEWIEGKSKFFNKEQLYNIYQGLPGVQKRGHDNYRKAIIEHMKEHFGLKEYSIGTDNVEMKNYVLIIDEINRGNISKIFGELITLIEEDKRIGRDQEHQLTVTLPYTGEGFGVPKNLYIIGTMNTSDRSIATVDIALRRRFKFKEMMPREDLVSNLKINKTEEETINFQEIFKALNEKISILLDRDHQIGHSYFMNIENTEDLKNVWFDEILPLLNEYFYNDWEKLQLLLGKASNDKTGFIKKIDNKYNIDDSILYDFTDETEIEDFEQALLKIMLPADDKTENE